MRNISKQLPDFVKDLIDDPYSFINIKPPLSIQQLEYLMKAFIKQEALKPNLIKLGPNFEDTLIIGDIHGDLKSVTKIVTNFYQEKIESLVFLGDYVDRGKYSLIAFAYLLSLAIAWPTRIQLLKGNHEDYKINKKYGFEKEIKQFFPKSTDRQMVQDIFVDIYNNISLCAITPFQSFCCHGGIPEGLKDLNDFNRIPKPHSDLHFLVEGDDLRYLQSLYRQINWNDPVEDQKNEFETSFRGLDIFTFNESAVEKFLDLTNCKRVIRAHESSRGAFQSIFDGKVLHIFSSELHFDKIIEAKVIHESRGEITVRDLNFDFSIDVKN